jgi:uncharacterized protein YhfF
VTDTRTDVPPPDLAAAEHMWRDYAAARPAAVRACSEYTVEHFGDSARLADKLLALVMHGPKRATAELVTEFGARGQTLPRIGSHWIACDGSGVPHIVIRSIELRIGTFDTVDAAFAFDEGEGDRSLQSWRAGHREYFARGCAVRGAVWSEDDEIVLERFVVVWPPDLAD